MTDGRACAGRVSLGKTVIERHVVRLHRREQEQCDDTGAWEARAKKKKKKNEEASQSVSQSVRGELRRMVRPLRRSLVGACFEAHAGERHRYLHLASLYTEISFDAIPSQTCKRAKLGAGFAFWVLCFLGWLSSAGQKITGRGGARLPS